MSRPVTGPRPVLVAAVAVALLGACSAGADEPAPAATAHPASSVSAPPAPASQAPTPSAGTPSAATPTKDAAGVVDRSDGALGIRFADIPDVTGQEADAVDVLQQFEVEFWRSLVDAKVSSKVADLATPSVEKLVGFNVDSNKKNGWTVSGEETDTFTKTREGKNLVVVDLCVDSTKTTYTKDGATQSGTDVGQPTFSVRAEVGLVDGSTWRVQSYRTGDAC